MIRLKLNLRKLANFRTFTGKDGIEYVAFPIKANAIFMNDNKASLDVTLLTNKSGPDQYDQDGFAVVDIGKERREAGERGPIIGNWRDTDRKKPEAAAAAPANDGPELTPEGDEIPF
jgi:hypothetical protein